LLILFENQKETKTNLASCSFGLSLLGPVQFSLKICKLQLGKLGTNNCLNFGT